MNILSIEFLRILYVWMGCLRMQYMPNTVTNQCNFLCTLRNNAEDINVPSVHSRFFLSTSFEFIRFGRAIEHNAFNATASFDYSQTRQKLKFISSLCTLYGSMECKSWLFEKYYAPRAKAISPRNEVKVIHSTCICVLFEKFIFCDWDRKKIERIRLPRMFLNKNGTGER